MGGRCVDITYNDGTFVPWSERCDEKQPTTNTADNMHVLYKGVGVVKNYDTSAEQVLWLRVTNQSEYRGWNVQQNGVKRGSGINAGYFGVVNLMGPRTADQARAWTPVRKACGNAPFTPC